jgi:hypothetical protein
MAGFGGAGGAGAGAGLIGMAAAPVASTNSASSTARAVLNKHLIGTAGGYYLLNDTDFSKYNQLLALVDSIHDEWKDSRGDLTDAEREIIHKQLILSACKIIGKDPSTISADLTIDQIMNQLLAEISGTSAAPIFNVSNIEKTTVQFLESADPDRIYPFDSAPSFSFDQIVSLPDYKAMYDLVSPHRTCKLSSKGGRTIPQLSADEKKKLSDFIKIFMFGTNVFKTNVAGLFDGMDRSKMTYVTADAAIGQISDIMELDDDTRGLVTQATVADSATSSAPKIGTNGDYYMFVPIPPAIYPPGDGVTETFVTRNNTFTAQSGYQIGMINRSFTAQKNNFDFVIQRFTGAATPTFTKAFNLSELGAKQGASLPYILDLSVAAQNGEELAAVAHSSKMIPIGNLDTEFAAAITADIRSGNGNVFFDIKRGGDLDQIVAAVVASKTLSPYIIFVTIDISAFYAAIKESLPAIRRHAAAKSDDEFYLARPYHDVKIEGPAAAAGAVDPVRAEKAYIFRYANLYYQLMGAFPEVNVQAFLQIDPSTIPLTNAITQFLFVTKLQDINELLVKFLLKRQERLEKVTFLPPNMDGLTNEQIVTLKSEIEQTLTGFRSINITPDMLAGICDTFYGKPPAPMDMTRSYTFCNYSLDIFSNLDKSFTEMAHIDTLSGIYSSPLDPLEVTDSVFRERLTKLLNGFYNKDTAEAIRVRLIFENIISHITTFTTVGEITPLQIRKGINTLRGQIQEYRDNEKAATLQKRVRKATSKIDVKEVVTKETAMNATKRLINAIKVYYAGLHNSPNIEALRIMLNNPAIGAAGVAAAAAAGPILTTTGGGKGILTQRGGAVVTEENDVTVVAEAFETLCAKASKFVNNYIAQIEPAASLIYAVANIQHEYDILISLGKNPTPGDPESMPLFNAIRGFGKEATLFTGNPALEEAIVTDIVGTRFMELVANRTIEHIKSIVEHYCGAGTSAPIYSLAEIQALIPSTDVIELIKEIKIEWIFSTQAYADDPTVKDINLLLDPYTTAEVGGKTVISIKYTHPLTKISISPGIRYATPDTDLSPLLAYYNNDAIAELQALMTLALANDFINPTYGRNESVFLPYLYTSNPANLQIGIRSPAEWTKLKNRLLLFYTTIVMERFPDEFKGLLTGGALSPRRHKTRRNKCSNKAPNPYQSYTRIAKSLKAKQKRRRTRRRQQKN